MNHTVAVAGAGTMVGMVNSTEFCDWRVQSQGDCEGTTYISFLYTTHIISSFLFLFISAGILIHNIWWKGQKVWEFSRNDNAFRPRPTEGFVFWCAGYFFFRCVLSVLLLIGVHDGKRGFLENFADLPWVFVSGAMGFYLVGIIYATPASFSSNNSYSKKRRSHDFDAHKNNNSNNTSISTTVTGGLAAALGLGAGSGAGSGGGSAASPGAATVTPAGDSSTTLNKEGGLNNVQMESKRVYLPKPMVLNFTLIGMIVLPLITNQILASFAGAAFDRGQMEAYSKLISAMYGVWTVVVIVIFVLYIFFGKQLLTIISSNMATVHENVGGRVSSRVASNSDYEDHERQLNTLKSTYQRMRAILILCGSLSPLMGLMMLFFAIFRKQILNSAVASEVFSLVWIHGASVALGCSLIFILFRKS
ncbi:hypothetical protein BGX31_000776 [Mortierella sp. GBA43]|nr:hypothetical protein BGX31_000776 [Mortierella sp. GBA43]